MRLTYLVTFLTKVAEKIFIIMQFQAVIEVISTYDDMIVEVVSVYMGGDYRLVIFEFVKASDKLHADIVRLLR